jgi:hypothetical protein
MEFSATPHTFEHDSPRKQEFDADLGWLEKLFPARQAQAALEGRIKGLLT